MAAGGLAGMALSAALVGGGYAIGIRDGDDPAPVVEESAATPAVATPDQQQPQAPATTAPPLTSEDEVEPVTAVARAVSPSVVRIDTGIGQGSGIVWDAANGYIITNDHVTDDASSVSVLFDNGVEVSGVVVGGDPARDVAVVQVDPR